MPDSIKRISRINNNLGKITLECQDVTKYGHVIFGFVEAKNITGVIKLFNRLDILILAPELCVMTTGYVQSMCRKHTCIGYLQIPQVLFAHPLVGNSPGHLDQVHRRLNADTGKYKLCVSRPRLVRNINPDATSPGCRAIRVSHTSKELKHGLLVPCVQVPDAAHL